MGNAFQAARRFMLKTEAEGTLRVVISIPHAVDGSESTVRGYHDHPRDPAAPEIAKLVEAALRKKGFEVQALYGDRPRKEIDYNREPSRSSPWRKKLTEMMKDADLLLDIHSYPAWDREFDPYDSVVFTNYIRSDIRDHYLDIMGESLNVLSYNCTIKTDEEGQAHTHDIIQEAQAYEIPAILLEFHDKWTEKPQKPADAVIGATEAWLAEE